MRHLFLAGALLVGAVVPNVAAARPSESWSDQANRVCVVWTAKAKREFASPVKPSELYGFAVKAKALESQELAELAKIPGATPAGAKALGTLRADVAEVGSAITAWNKGDKAAFVQILKQYLNDSRPKIAFAAAGASKCG
jgi:hypothetical protein